MRRFILLVTAPAVLLLLAGSSVLGDDATELSARAKARPGSGGSAPLERQADYTLLLESRRFVPEPGVSRALAARDGTGGRLHAIIQFHRIPGRDEIAELESRGIDLLDYLPNLAYFASLPAGEIGLTADFPGVRSLEVIRPDDKVAPRFKDRAAGRQTQDDEGALRVVTVLFGDVPVGDVLGMLEQYGRITAVRDEDNAVEMEVEKHRLLDLAGLDEVRWIEPAAPPKRLLLDDVRATVGGDSVQAAPYGLSGSGVALGMWDGGSPAATHEDFAGRLVIADGAGTSDHATSVAGIMAGDGSRSEAWGGTPYQWRGLSTQADIIAYDFPDGLPELRTETSEAIATYGIVSSSNSWGWSVCGMHCSYLGVYDTWTKVYDNIVLGSRGAPINVICGAGNDQNCIECQDSLPDFPYGTVAGPMATAKNVIAVGAVNALDRTMTDFSSWGPVKDGRLKPDMVAPGCKLTGGVMSPVPPNDYDNPDCGTSYSTPVVSGSVGILRQQFDLLGYGQVMPHTFKAILIHTAEDLGNAGPDYVFGHGCLRLKAAVDMVIANHPAGELVRVDSLLNAEADTYHMEVPPGTGKLRVTLVWDDFRGTPGVAKLLVNDLDLLLRSPSESWHYAYKLDPANPSALATTGYNDLDNVEVVEVASPEAGRWTIEVHGSLVPEAPQQYTLVLPFDDPSAGMGGGVPAPPGFKLFPNRPDPFGKATEIRFELAGPAVVNLRIYDARGRAVRTLIDGTLKPAGTHAAYWEGKAGSGRAVSPGVYFCRLEVGGRTETQRMVFLK